MVHFSTRLVLFSALLLAAAGCRPRSYNSNVKDSWDAGTDNNPKYFENQGKIEYNFDQLKLMTSGSLDTQPWSDWYWPNAEGGITARWRHEEAAKRFGYKSPYTVEEIERMSYEQINMLSPAEKFDIISGGYRNGWPMWRREASLTTSCPIGLASNRSSLPTRDAPQGMGTKDWEGKCHAWTPAALHFKEPRPVDVLAKKSNGESFKVHFGSSDVKALLIVGYDMYLGQYPQYSQAGKRCFQGATNLGAGSVSPCLDTNAGTFFVLATNFLQPGKKGFTFDVETSPDVWNQPAWKYEHQISDGSCPIRIENPAKANERVAHVRTKLYWISEYKPNEVAHGSGNNVQISNYEYCVEIDPESNHVIGGEWISKERPDFIWMAGKPDFSGSVKDTRTGQPFDLSVLAKIYEQSQNPGASAAQPTQPTTAASGNNNGNSTASGQPQTPVLSSNPVPGGCRQVKVTGGSAGEFWVYSKNDTSSRFVVGTAQPNSIHNVIRKSGAFYILDGARFNQPQVYIWKDSVECSTR